MTIIIITLFIALFVRCIFVIHQDFKQKKEIEDTIFSFSQGNIILTPSEFLEIRNKSFGGQGRPKYANYFGFIGIYIILNNSKKNYYIGQSQKVIDGINKQFTGKGNQYLYNDYITGDTFLTKAIRLDTSGFYTIEEFKKCNVDYYNQEYQSYSSSMRNNKIQSSKQPKDRTANTLNNSPVVKKYTVTGRVKDIKQPYGGYLPVKEFEVISFEDKKYLGEENIHGSLVGITVDYLTRFVNGASASKAFSVSLLGAQLVKKEEEAKKLLNNIDSLSDISITSACKLSGFDVAFRAGPAFYTKSIEDINPDDSTIKNI